MAGTWKTVGVLAAVGSAFTVGVLTGAGAGDDAAPTPARPIGVLDDAADQISGAALRPVPRASLDSAAIAGMLHAAGDPWGTWSDGPPAASRSSRTSAVSTALEAGAPAVGRITVPAFSRGTGRAVRTALATLRAGHATAVIVDLRGNPGGLLDEAVETASAFLDGGRVVSYTRRTGAPVVLDAVGHGDTTTPLVVLVDGGTASAAEVVAGALQDRGRAVVVGGRTFGKGTVQEPRTLSDGSALELTIARYATPSGHSVDGMGLVPDIDIAAGAPPEVAVRRAVQVLAGLLADSSSGRRR